MLTERHSDILKKLVLDLHANNEITVMACDTLLATIHQLTFQKEHEQWLWDFLLRSDDNLATQLLKQLLKQ